MYVCMRSSTGCCSNVVYMYVCMYVYIRTQHNTPQTLSHVQISLPTLQHAVHTLTCSNFKHSHMFKFQTLSHVQISNTLSCSNFKHSLMFKFQTLSHVQMSNTLSCSNFKPSHMFKFQTLSHVQISNTLTCSNFKHSHSHAQISLPTLQHAVHTVADVVHYPHTLLQHPQKSHRLEETHRQEAYGV